MQNLLRPAVQALADQMELGTSNSRPTPEYWEQRDKEEFMRKSIDRHSK
jgi:hypothetical protein